MNNDDLHITLDKSEIEPGIQNPASSDKQPAISPLPIKKLTGLKSLSKTIPKELKPVPVPDKPSVENPNWFDRVKLWLYNTITIKEEFSMWQTIKNYLVTFIVRWLMKVLAGVLLALGLNAQTTEEFLIEIIGAIITFIVGAAISLITHKKVALSDPDNFKTYI